MSDTSRPLRYGVKLVPGQGLGPMYGVVDIPTQKLVPDFLATANVAEATAYATYLNSGADARRQIDEQLLQVLVKQLMKRHEGDWALLSVGGGCRLVCLPPGGNGAAEPIGDSIISFASGERLLEIRQSLLG